jgi:hypothetical protein
MYTALLLTILYGSAKYGEFRICFRIWLVSGIKKLSTPLLTVVYAFPWELPARRVQEIATELVGPTLVV